MHYSEDIHKELDKKKTQRRRRHAMYKPPVRVIVAFPQQEARKANTQPCLP